MASCVTTIPTSPPSFTSSTRRSTRELAPTSRTRKEPCRLSPRLFRGADDVGWEYSDEASVYVPVHDPHALRVTGAGGINRSRRLPAGRVGTATRWPPLPRKRAAHLSREQLAWVEARDRTQ
jgi:hypothetical protein